ncbi:transporter [Caulobacter sp. 1776]|uniref:transporter n=1 Tax=Caulobacter sp. 1776 TaxID=3156420 RepID=UPI003397FED6
MSSTIRRAALMAAAASALAAPAFASSEAPRRQSLDEAWWTGPLLASGAGTLPTGHILFEPYLYDAKPYGSFDADGKRHSAPDADNIGSSAYMLYGVTDTLTAGFIPHLGYRRAGGRWSQGLGIGDLTAQAQYRLMQYEEGKRPTLSVMLQENLPIGRHDHLEGRPNDGFGSGAYATTVGLNSQYLFWMPNGRILRTRLNAQYTRSDNAKVRGASVYGTPTGFTGKAQPGDSFLVNLAFEYSITRNWVAAMDLAWQRDDSTKVTGRLGGGGFERRYPVSKALILAPAVEYNFNSSVGVIVGARIVPAGRNVTASVTPAIAVNYVR